MELAASIEPFLSPPAAFMEPTESELYLACQTEYEERSGDNTSTLRWKSSLTNPCNKINAWYPLVTPGWRIDGVTGMGRRIFALPTFMLPDLPLRRIDLIIPCQSRHPAPLRRALGSSLLYSRSGRAVKDLEICEYIVQVLTRWSSKQPDFKQLYRSLPFGSKIIVKDIVANLHDVKVSILPNDELPEKLLTVSTLQTMWKLSPSLWPTEVSLEQLQHVAQFNGNVSAVHLPHLHCSETLVFKTNLGNPKYMYHELKLLLTKSIHPNVVSKPRYVVTLGHAASHSAKVVGFILDYYSSGTFQDVIDSGFKPCRSLQMKWSTQIVRAFYSIRNSPAGFYSDLKPDNIMFSQQTFDIVLIDFEQGGNWDTFLAPEIFYVRMMAKLAANKVVPVEKRTRYDQLVRTIIPQPAPTEEIYSNPPNGYYNAWTSLTPYEQELANMEKLMSGDGAAGDERALDIVVIPGVDTARVSEWHDSSGSWLECILRTTAPQAQLWEYTYELDDSNSACIDTLLNEGDNLLKNLEVLQLHRSHQPRPVLFICHSLGGLILKKALCLARQQFLQYRKIIDVISGVIFLGVPHISPNTVDESNVLDSILRSTPKTPQKRNVQKEDHETFLTLCRDFELVRLQVPILSVYEGKETRLHENKVISKFRKPRQLIIVNKNLAQVGADSETTIEADATHPDICVVRVATGLYHTVDEFVRKFTEEAPAQVQNKFRSYEVPHPLKQQDLRSRSSAEPRQQDASGVAHSTTLPVHLLGLPEDDSRHVAVGTTDASFEIVPFTSGFEAPTRINPKLPCFSLRPHERNKNFYGRQDQLNLIDKFFFSDHISGEADQAKTLRAFGICGMGGIGKTQLAVEYAYSRRDHFDAVFLLHADQPNILGESFANIAQELGIEDAGEGRDLTVSRERVQGWLSRPVKMFDAPDSYENEAKWLIIFDNVDNLETLGDYWPVTGNGCVLVTSRDPQAKADWYTPNTGIDLDKFSPEEATGLLRSLTKLTRDNDQGKSLRRIADKLDGYPLAIERVAGIIRDVRVSYSEFQESYDKKGVKFIHKIAGDSKQKDYQHSLATVWVLEELPTQSIALLEVLSLLDPDQIPESMLTHGMEDVEMANYPGDDISYWRARGELLKSSLIKQNEERQEIYLHRLVQDVTRVSMDKIHTIDVFHAALRLVSKSWPFQSLVNRHSRARWPECARLFPQVLRVKQAAEWVTESTDDTDSGIELANLLNDAGWYLFERGGIGESREYFEAVQRICESSEQKSSEVVQAILRECLNNQGSAAAEMNDRGDCLHYNELWLKIMLQRRSGTGSPIRDYELAITYNELGVAYGFNGRYDDAARCFMESIAIMKALGNFKRTMLGWPMPNLGFISWAQGKLNEAEGVLREILEIHRVAYGPDDVQSFKTGKILHALGNVLWSQDRMDESLDFHNRALTQYRVTQGDTHHRTADVCHRLAGHFIRLGRYSEAELLIDQALKIFSSRAYYQNEIARTTFKKGQLRRAQGRVQEAAACFYNAYLLRRKLVETDQRPQGELAEHDYDSLIIFWSK